MVLKGKNEGHRRNPQPAVYPKPLSKLLEGKEQTPETEHGLPEDVEKGGRKEGQEEIVEGEPVGERQ